MMPQPSLPRGTEGMEDPPWPSGSLSQRGETAFTPREAQSEGGDAAPGFGCCLSEGGQLSIWFPRAPSVSKDLRFSPP